MSLLVSHFSMLVPHHKTLCCCSAAQSCPALGDTMDCSAPGLPFLHHQKRYSAVNPTTSQRVGSGLRKGWEHARINHPLFHLSHSLCGTIFKFWENRLNVCSLTLNHRTFRLEETSEIFQFGEFSNFLYYTTKS